MNLLVCVCDISDEFFLQHPGSLIWKFDASWITATTFNVASLPHPSTGLGGEKEEKEGKERKRKKRERRRFKAEIPCACNVDIPDDIIIPSGHCDWSDASSVGKSTRTRFPSSVKTPLL